MLKDQLYADYRKAATVLNSWQHYKVCWIEIDYIISIIIKMICLLVNYDLYYISLLFVMF